MSDERRRTMKNIAARLSAPDEMLSLEEARTLAAIAATDRLLEILGALQDIQVRLTRMELFISSTFPAYGARVAQQAALSNGQADH